MLSSLKRKLEDIYRTKIVNAVIEVMPKVYFFLSVHFGKSRKCNSFKRYSHDGDDILGARFKTSNNRLSRTLFKHPATNILSCKYHAQNIILYHYRK